MYGHQTGDLANALMADRNRYAAQLALERSARRSRPARPNAGSSGRPITALLGAALASIRTALVRLRPRTPAY